MLYSPQKASNTKFSASGLGRANNSYVRPKFSFQISLANLTALAKHYFSRIDEDRHTVEVYYLTTFGGDSNPARFHRNHGKTTPNV